MFPVPISSCIVLIFVGILPPRDISAIAGFIATHLYPPGLPFLSRQSLPSGWDHSKRMESVWATLVRSLLRLGLSCGNEAGVERYQLHEQGGKYFSTFWDPVMAHSYTEKRRRFVIVRRPLLNWWVGTELSVTVSLHPKSFTWTTFTESSPKYDALRHSLLIWKVTFMLVPLMVSLVTGKSQQQLWRILEGRSLQRLCHWIDWTSKNEQVHNPLLPVFIHLFCTAFVYYIMSKKSFHNIRAPKFVRQHFYGELHLN